MVCNLENAKTLTDNSWMSINREKKFILVICSKSKKSAFDLKRYTTDCNARLYLSCQQNLLSKNMKLSKNLFSLFLVIDFTQKW